MPALATSASSGSVNAASTASRSLMSTSADRRAVQVRLVTVEQRQARTLRGEPLGDREPDAARRPGDGDMLPGEPIHVGESTSAARSEDRSASAAITNVAAATVSTASTTASTLCVS